MFQKIFLSLDVSSLKNPFFAVPLFSFMAALHQVDQESVAAEEEESQDQQDDR